MDQNKHTENLNEEHTIVYKRYDDPFSANLAKGLLESYGIPSFVSDENIVNLNRFYNYAAGGVKLNIFEKDLDEVNRIMTAEAEHNKEAEDYNDSEIKCPVCGSGNVRYGVSVKKKFALSNLVPSFLLVLYPIIPRKMYHCFNCDAEFKI